MIKWQVDLANTITNAGMILALHRCQSHVYRYSKGAIDHTLASLYVCGEFRNVFRQLKLNGDVLDYEIVCNAENNTADTIDRKLILVSVQCQENSLLTHKGTYVDSGVRGSPLMGSLALKFENEKMTVSFER